MFVNSLEIDNAERLIQHFGLYKIFMSVYVRFALARIPFNLQVTFKLFNIFH